ncbi:hypothetical protein VTN49DRAFT_3078 [Thermomyces lanuginosus]|uniref:uncharacterized protein n=1 Tax=Thermomyces lanuginosus TaxID=5541 RepID=UPI003742756D
MPKTTPLCPLSFLLFSPDEGLSLLGVYNMETAYKMKDADKEKTALEQRAGLFDMGSSLVSLGCIMLESMLSRPTFPLFSFVQSSSYMSWTA